MHYALRAGAVICLVLAALTLLMASQGASSLLGRELVVSSKYESESGSGTQFRLSCELPYPERGFTYDMSAPRRFYDAAKTGDSLHSPLPGYFKLIREGRVVARHFSSDVVVPAVYALVALFPSLAFLKLERLPMRRIFLAIICIVEIGVVGVFLYGTLAGCC